VLWIAASMFGICQVPLIMKNMLKDEDGEEEKPGPVSPDPGL
jgi:intracellular septation protein